jgi:hypothetical protein
MQRSRGVATTGRPANPHGPLGLNIIFEVVDVQVRYFRICGLTLGDQRCGILMKN